MTGRVSSECGQRHWHLQFFQSHAQLSTSWLLWQHLQTKLAYSYWHLWVYTYDKPDIVLQIPIWIFYSANRHRTNSDITYVSTHFKDRSWQITLNTIQRYANPLPTICLNSHSQHLHPATMDQTNATHFTSVIRDLTHSIKMSLLTSKLKSKGWTNSDKTERRSKIEMPSEVFAS